MIAFAIAILALAAGVHLLIQVKQSGLGFFYKLLAWKVILIAGFFMVGLVVVGVIHHHRYTQQCQMPGQCGMGHGDMGYPYMHHSGCMHDGSCGKCGAGSGGCSKGAEGNMPACCKKDGEEGKAPCCTKSADKTMAPCCHKGAATDTTAKK